MPTRRRLSRALLAATVAAVALAGTGCGAKEAETTEAPTEGIWIDVGPLDYHIQGSRVLEPGLQPDKSYLAGVPAEAAQPTGEEVWFAVFLRIENKTDAAAPTATDFEIVDTQGKSFAPYRLEAKSNPFAYQQTTLQPKQVVPYPDSAQDFDSVAGAELLFKLPLDSYQNRPLAFKIHSADGAEPAEGSIDLDV